MSLEIPTVDIQNLPESHPQILSSRTDRRASRDCSGSRGLLPRQGCPLLSIIYYIVYYTILCLVVYYIWLFFSIYIYIYINVCIYIYIYIYVIIMLASAEIALRQ